MTGEGMNCPIRSSTGRYGLDQPLGGSGMGVPGTRHHGTGQRRAGQHLLGVSAEPDNTGPANTGPANTVPAPNPANAPGTLTTVGPGQNLHPGQPGAGRHNLGDGRGGQPGHHYAHDYGWLNAHCNGHDKGFGGGSPNAMVRATTADCS